MKKEERIAAHLTVLALTKLFVILSAKRERIRLPFKRITDCHSRLHGFAMTKVEERIAAHLTVLALTKLFVILSAKRERIRLPFKRITDCHSRLHGFAMTGRGIIKTGSIAFAAILSVIAKYRI